MTKYTQTQQDLHNHLCEQLRFLRNSAASFDNGFEGEAKRLATTIRVLVHDSKKSKSLLQQLNMKQPIQMSNTARPLDPRNLTPHQGLVIMRMEALAGESVSISLPLHEQKTAPVPADPEGYHANPPTNQARSKVIYVPLVNATGWERPPTHVSFTDWWEEIVIKDSSGIVFKRRDLVLTVADQEGGAHVDPKLDKDYARLSRFHSQGWQVRIEGAPQLPDNSLVAASIRQIAREVLLSIERAFPGICPDGN